MLSTRSGRLRVGLVLAAGLAVILAGFWAMPASSAGGLGAACHQVAFPVQVQGQHTLRGTLCRPTGVRQPRAAILLVHGSTYSRTYWDPPVHPSRYSALRLLANRGYLTLAIDRLGSGQSDRPPNEEVTADASAAALAQVAAKLRRTPTRSGKLFLVGHSSGSTLAIRTAYRHGGIDGVVATGFLHATGPGSDLFFGLLHPAALDPKFANDPSIPAGYVTTRPGLRSRIWLYGYNSEESIANLEEQALKDAMPETDSGGFVDEAFGEGGGPFARHLTIPVLVMVGDRDLDFCTPPTCPQAADEAGSYPKSPDVQVIVRPRVAHSLNLHLNARETTDLIRRWADQHSR